MRILPRLAFWALVTAVASACGGSPGPASSLPSSRVILYRNGVGYFERDTLVTDGELSVAVRTHELDDVLTTLAVVDRTEGGSGRVVPVAALPPPRGTEDDADTIHRLRFAVGVGRRSVRVAWATQTPAWRVSYRLVLPGPNDGGRGHLSGWAVVDNTTAEDWEDVELTLATAEPLSFAVDMRTPRYVDRPDITGYVAPRIVVGPVSSEAYDRLADHDADGILDQDDRCPDEPEVMNGLDDDDGCPDRGVVRIESNELSILESIQFEPDSVDIGRAAHPILDAIAATLQGNPGIRAEVHGHAAPNEASPYLIAAERAGAVREALIARGVAPHRLVVRGFGATRPIDPRTSPDASARNRRVSFSVAHDDERLPNTGVTARAMSRQRRGLTRARTGIGGTRYVIGRRIDVPAGRSALVPAVNVDVTAEEVFLFRPDPDVPRSDESPYRAARVDNASEIDLVPGPVALYGRGGLLGQGLLDGLRAGEDVIIPWELDDSTRVRSERREDSAPVAVLSVSGSRAVLRREVTERVTYTVRVGRHAPRQMLVHHEIHSGGTLVSPPPGTTRGDGFALVPLPIADSESSILEVVETRFVDSSIDLRQDISLDLEDFVSGTTMTPEDRLRFDEIRRDRAALRQSDAQTRALSQRLSEHGVRSAEIRAALESLPDGPSVAAVRRRLAEQLLASVTDGEAISRELGALRASEIEARGRLRAVAAGFTWPLRQDDALAAASEGGSEE